MRKVKAGAACKTYTYNCVEFSYPRAVLITEASLRISFDKSAARTRSIKRDSGSVPEYPAAASLSPSVSRSRAHGDSSNSSKGSFRAHARDQHMGIAWKPPRKSSSFAPPQSWRARRTVSHIRLRTGSGAEDEMPYARRRARPCRSNFQPHTYPHICAQQSSP